MHTILNKEFCTGELKDIVNHGMSAGVSGFIYSSELHDCFESNTEVIMDYLDDMADQLGDEPNGYRMVLNSMERRGIEFDSLQVFKEQAVWMYVECIAMDLLLSIGEEY